MASLELFTDKDVENFKEIKRLLQEIIELNNSFSLSNIIELNKKDILVFRADFLLNRKQMEFAQEDLEKRFGCKCIVLPSGLALDKVIQEESKKIGYETEIFYADGEVIREVTTQYK